MTEPYIDLRETLYPMNPEIEGELAEETHGKTH